MPKISQLSSIKEIKDISIVFEQSGLTYVFQRLFPWSRGIYEDKVANLWCSISPVFKVKQLYSIEFLRKLCLSTTLMAILPSSIALMIKQKNVSSHQRAKLFLLCLSASSMAFFLFSYHVHEK